MPNGPLANRDWSPTEMELRTDGEMFLKRLAKSGRWETSISEGKQSVDDEFGAFKLVAIVTGEITYALLRRPQLGPGLESDLIRVQVGDQLANGWQIESVVASSVLAKRDDEVQRLELFGNE
ncbi:MAG: hypothetical protein JJ956_09410 [Pseudomonadales bacterium]|nr:hypothetical protein [Pseudomonadales bacterium]